MKATKEQIRFWKFLKKRPENILIKAYAGTGKTFTIVEGLKYIPSDKKITYLAFNRHIKEDLEAKLPNHVKCYTTYGVGLGALKKVYGDKTKFDEFKIDKIIKSKSKTWGLEQEFKTTAKVEEYLNSMKKLVNLCKLTLTIKPDFISLLASKHSLRMLTDKKHVKRVLKVLDASTQNMDTFDYVDMIYIPATDKKIWMYPQDYIVVDEIQDLNMCQIRIIQKMLKKDRVSKKVLGRLIAVGDFFQNIYGFNGCTEKSFEWFEKYPNTEIMTLSTSFRCSKNVIKEAQRIVPEIKAMDDAPEGSVRRGNVLEEAKDGDFVLCRTTAPLVALFFQFLVQKKKVVIKGSDIGLGLIQLIGKIKTIDELNEYWTDEINKYKFELKRKGILNPYEHSGFVSLDDKVSTLLFISKMATDINDLKTKINTIFTDKLQGIVLSTIHKIKGLEADNVFIVRPDKLPLPNAKGWEYAQEMNLKYVAITRAKNNLIVDNNWTDEEQ